MILSSHKAVIGNSRGEEHICRQAVIEMDRITQKPANLYTIITLLVADSFRDFVVHVHHNTCICVYMYMTVCILWAELMTLQISSKQH